MNIKKLYYIFHIYTYYRSREVVSNRLSEFQSNLNKGDININLIRNICCSQIGMGGKYAEGIYNLYDSFEFNHSNLSKELGVNSGDYSKDFWLFEQFLEKLQKGKQ
jgi:hypothetical protein